MDSMSDNGKPPAAVYASVTMLAMAILMACNRPSNAVSIISPQPNLTADSSSTAAVLKKKKKKKRLYLTFDDGPNKGTANVLHIARDEDIPVSFFIVGEHVFGSSYQARMWDSLKAADDVELCNHSYCHAHSHYAKYYTSPNDVVKDFERT